MTYSKSFFAFIRCKLLILFSFLAFMCLVVVLDFFPQNNIIHILRWEVRNGDNPTPKEKTHLEPDIFDCEDKWQQEVSL